MAEILYKWDLHCRRKYCILGGLEDLLIFYPFWLRRIHFFLLGKTFVASRAFGLKFQEVSFLFRRSTSKKSFQKSFWLGCKQSCFVDGGMDVFGNFFIVSWLVDNVTPRSPFFSFFFKFRRRVTFMQGFIKLWLVFQEIGVFQQNQFVPV